MADPSENPNVEEVFNRNVDALLEGRGLKHRDLLKLLEAAEGARGLLERPLLAKRRPSIGARGPPRPIVSRLI